MTAERPPEPTEKKMRCWTDEEYAEAQRRHDRFLAGVAERRDPPTEWDPTESEEDAANLRHVSAIVDRVLKVAEGHDAKNALAPWIATEILEEIGPRLRAIDLRGAGPQPIRSALEQIAEKLEYNAGGSFPGWIRRELSELALLARGALRAGGPAPEETIRSMAEFRKKFFPDTEPAESRPSTWSGGGPAREEPTLYQVAAKLYDAYQASTIDYAARKVYGQALRDFTEAWRALSSGLPAPEEGA